MSHLTTIPGAVCDFSEFKAQWPWFRLAVFALANTLSKFGDGGMSDVGLRGECGLEPNEWSLLLEQLLVWGWLERDAAGRLHRAGLLLPPSPRALRMREYRRTARCGKEEEPGEGAQEAHEPAIRRADEAHARAANRAQNRHESAQSVPFPLHPSDIRSDSDSESESDIRSGSESESEIRSDSRIQISDARALSTRSVVLLPPELARESSFSRLHAEGVSAPVLIEAARRMQGRHVALWKEKYLRSVVKKIAAGGQEEAKSMGYASKPPSESGGLVPVSAARRPAVNPSPDPIPDTVKAQLHKIGLGRVARSLETSRQMAGTAL